MKSLKIKSANILFSESIINFSKSCELRITTEKEEKIINIVNSLYNYNFWNLLFMAIVNNIEYEFNLDKYIKIKIKNNILKYKSKIERYNIEINNTLKQLINIIIQRSSLLELN